MSPRPASPQQSASDKPSASYVAESSDNRAPATGDSIGGACPLRPVIFDFDGTLVDSMGVWEQIDVKFFAKYHLPLTRENAETITTLGFEAGSKFVREQLGLTSRSEQQIIDEWNDMAVPHYAHQVAFRSGALELLEWLADNGAQMGICTSNQHRLVMATVHHYHAERYFEHLLCTNDEQLVKADPRAFELAAEMVGCRPEGSLVFEDTAPCARAAREAGFTVVGIRDAHSQQDTTGLMRASDFFIDSFAQIAPGSDLNRQIFCR